MSDLRTSHLPYKNFYECPCGTSWEDDWTCACDDECPECHSAISPTTSTINPFIIELPETHGIKVTLTELDPNYEGDQYFPPYVGGEIKSTLLTEIQLPSERMSTMELTTAQHGLENSVQTLESMILACACSGIDIESPAFIKAIEIVANEISNEFGK